MICTTTSNLDGKEIEKYLGVVVGEAILGANIFKDLFGIPHKNFHFATSRK